MKTVILLLMPLAAAAAPQPTARQVVERIQKNIGVGWRAETVDTFKAGNPDTPVTGIATTFAATLDVLQRAAASGKNFVIAHEPTFYNHLDKTDELKNDSVLAAKQAFIAQHHMVVLRFHDHWHMRRPDGILAGMTQALGWQKARVSGEAPLFAFPGTTLDRLTANIKDRLKIRTIRVVGDPGMKVARVALLPGAAGSTMQIQLLERDDVDVLVVGESREWETVEYVRDAVTAGKKKALILMGHVPSEEAGMDECARWLKTILPEVAVEFIPAGEPFWTPR